MPDPIPVTIDYRVERITHKLTLKEWNIKISSAMFLCRVTKIGYGVIDSVPVAVFNLDSEGYRFSTDFLKHEDIT
jgi:hypothetical protein